MYQPSKRSIQQSTCAAAMTDAPMHRSIISVSHLSRTARDTGRVRIASHSSDRTSNRYPTTHEKSTDRIQIEKRVYISKGCGRESVCVVCCGIEYWADQKYTMEIVRRHTLRLE